MTTTAGPADVPYVHTDESAADLRRRFPAKFTASVLDTIQAELQLRFLHTATILDPFAGTGLVHTLADRLPVTTVGIEIEPEVAALHPRTVCGDSRRASTFQNPLAAITGTPDGYPFRAQVIVTSPAYGNRFADQYLGSDTEQCRACLQAGEPHPPVAGTDKVRFIDPDCKKCDGTGCAKSTRAGYAIALGRRLTPGSGAAAQWGQKYKRLHLPVLQDVDRLLEPGGWWMVNVSSSIRQEAYADVMEWWVERLAERARIVALRAIETPRNGFGQNGDDRVPVEHLIVAQKAG